MSSDWEPIMTWSKLKEKIEDHIVTIVFALITILCLTIWQAIPSEVWIQLGAAIPKRALAAFIGLLLIALSTSLAYNFSLRRKLRDIRGEEQTKPSDENAKLDNYEPDEKEKEILLYLFKSNDGKPIEDINRRLRFKYEQELSYHLSRLDKHGFTYVLPIVVAGQSLDYYLTNKGREYVLHNLLPTKGDI